MTEPEESGLDRTIPPRAGLAVLGLAAAFAVLYFRFPVMRAWWPSAFYPLFWFVEASLALLGVALLVWRYIPPEWTRGLPQISRHRVLIPREGIGYLLIMTVLFIGSTLTQENRLLLVFSAMAGPFVINGWIIYMMLKSVRVTRRAPPRAMAGELFSVELDLQNEAHWMSMWMMVVEDRVVFQSALWEPAVLFTRVPPRLGRTGHYQLRLLQRGRHVFGPLQVSCRFPLGLVERGCSFPVASEILIYPRIGRLSPAWKRRLLGATELIEVPQPKIGVFDDEFHHLREYRSGDNPRAIHWRSSARRNLLIVREFQQNREHNLLVLIDAYGPPRTRGASSAGVEEALSVAATLCLEHRRECRGARLTVVAAGQTHWKWEATVSSAALDSLFDRFAVLEPSLTNDFARMATDARAQAGAATRIVVISTRSEKSAFQGDGRGWALHAAAVQWMEVTPRNLEELVHFAETLPAPTEIAKKAALLASAAEG